MFNVDHMMVELWPQAEQASWMQRLIMRLMRPIYLQTLKPDSWLKRLFRRLLCEKEFQAFAANSPRLRGLDMVEQVLKSLNLRCEVSEHSLEHIPKQGPVIIVANHPTGAAEAFVLPSVVSRVRRDMKGIANQLLMHMEPVASLLIPVDKVNERVSENARKQMHEQLENGGALVICPAGDVSRIKMTGLQDKKWRAGFVRMARKYRAPILPIFVHGHNSLGFYITSLIAPPLATLLYVQQMFRRRNSTMHFTIGEPISFDSWSALKLSDHEIAEKFRRHVIRLGKGRPGDFK
ncbi:MAG: lysophospholipid acyltransferase family protein [Burkholderiaceae bacterium]|jgi:putative hemolysin|nr:lysophospholipid acyltransferase family protein [Burkholderiaceae bacterium]